MIAFKVHGLPQPGGSKRGYPFKKEDGGLGVRVADDNPKAKPWQAAVAAAAAEVHKTGLLQGPLSVTMRFYRPRPKGHYGTGRNEGRVKDSAPKYPTTRPDAGKLARSTVDALTGVIWRDDALIVKLVSCKFYGQARCEIEIRELSCPQTN